MAILDLRSEESVSELDDETGADETPPGLDAIRAWLQKPRPWLHGTRLWIRWFGRRLRSTWTWAAANVPAAARRTARLASQGAKAARHVARASTTAAQVGRRLHDVGRIWRDSSGRTGAAGAKLADAAGKFRDFSTRVLRSASHGAAIGEEISSYGRVLGDLRRTEPPPVTRQAASQPARPLPASRPRERRLRAPASDHGTDAAERSTPGRPSAGSRSAPVPPPAPSDPSSASTKRAAVLEKLPWPLVASIRALGPKPRKRVLWPLIVDIVRERGWSTSRDLGLILAVGHRNLARRHLGPMVEAGLLELRHPELVSHRAQAYRVRPDVDSPGRVENVAT